MKNLLICLFAFICVSAYAFVGPVDRSVNLSYDGTALNGTLEKHFMNVKNGSAGTLVAGKVVVISTSADDGFTVLAGSNNRESGLCVMAVDCAASALCSCQVYGYNSSALFDAALSATAGEKIYLSSTNAGYIAAILAPSASIPSFGVFLDSSATSGAVEIFLMR